MFSRVLAIPRARNLGKTWFYTHAWSWSVTFKIYIYLICHYYSLMVANVSNLAMIVSLFSDMPK